MRANLLLRLLTILGMFGIFGILLLLHIITISTQDNGICNDICLQWKTGLPPFHAVAQISLGYSRHLQPPPRVFSFHLFFYQNKRFQNWKVSRSLGSQLINSYICTISWCLVGLDGQGCKQDNYCQAIVPPLRVACHYLRLSSMASYPTAHCSLNAGAKI